MTADLRLASSSWNCCVWSTGRLGESARSEEAEAEADESWCLVMRTAWSSCLRANLSTGAPARLRFSRWLSLSLADVGLADESRLMLEMVLALALEALRFGELPLPSDSEETLSLSARAAACHESVE